MTSSSQGYSLHFVRVWIGIGVAAFVLVVALSVFDLYSYRSEATRFMACQEKTRFDCEPSSMWGRFGWGTGTSTTDGVATNPNTTSDEPKQEETTRVVTTSDKAPTFLSVKPDGMALSNFRYLAKPGSKVKIQATITNANNADLYVIQRDETGTPNPKKIGALVKGDEDQYTADYTVPVGLFGELEIRAMGAKAGEITSMYIHVGATNDMMMGATSTTP